MVRFRPGSPPPPARTFFDLLTWTPSWSEKNSDTPPIIVSMSLPAGVVKSMLSVTLAKPTWVPVAPGPTGENEIARLVESASSAAVELALLLAADRESRRRAEQVLEHHRALRERCARVERLARETQEAATRAAALATGALDAAHRERAETVAATIGRLRTEASVRARTLRLEAEAVVAGDGVARLLEEEERRMQEERVCTGVEEAGTLVRQGRFDEARRLLMGNGTAPPGPKSRHCESPTRLAAT